MHANAGVIQALDNLSMSCRGSGQRTCQAEIAVAGPISQAMTVPLESSIYLNLVIS